ncbi:hypothetical protein AXG93_815s1450 [Marchantia polymorpha subsp. ruderalis]|uniref:DUF4283 domain-containing protein n=1 Tax=Marchantia polymorpha subsp. ruderalis TaxID=1480154 RepID=A0A176W218_MARPO|nr:hypothetical protein AXG93_815s1450 [Marchantia polymorpha subsp. ruderalis]
MSSQLGIPYGTPQMGAETNPVQQDAGQLTNTAHGPREEQPVASIEHRSSLPAGSGERHEQSTAISGGPRGLTRSQATMKDMQDSSEDETSDNDQGDCSSDDESTEETQADPEVEKELDLENTLNMLRQVSLVITRDDTLKKEETENLTAVLCFLDRGLSTPQVQEWAENALTRVKRLKILSITAIGSKNYHIRFQSQMDRDKALSRTRITYLRQDFIIVKWTLEAEDLSYYPAVYPVWVRFTNLSQLQLFWIKEIAGTLGQVLIGPASIERSSRPIIRLCLEWPRGMLPPPFVEVTLEGQTKLVDKEKEQKANIDRNEGAKGNSEENAPKKQRGEELREYAQAPQQAGTGATMQEAQSARKTGTIEQFYEKKKEGSVAQLTKIALTSASLQSKTRKEAADEQTTATSPAPLVRRNKVTPRPQGAGSGKVQAADAGSKRKPATDGDQSGGRAKMAKSLPRDIVDQVEPGDAREKWRPQVSPLVPKQLLETLAQKGGADHVDSIPVQVQKGIEEIPKHKEGYEETVPVEQPEPHPRIEGIRAKFTRKQVASQGPLAVLGGKTLSMKSSAIRKREMRSAKAAARAASGGQKPNKVRSSDIGSTSPAKTDIVGGKVDTEHGRAAFSEQ